MTTSSPSLDATQPQADTSQSGVDPGLIENGGGKIWRHKIMLALAIVVLLGLTVGQFCIRDEGHKTSDVSDGTASPESPGDIHGGGGKVGALTPAFATQFISWWITLAMDYSAQSATVSHNQAFGWMTPEACQEFQTCFWTRAIAQGVTQGTLVAAFQPVAVQAEAVNPDGSVVVCVTGTLVVQDLTVPTTQQVTVDFLIKREKDGLRVAGLYNRTRR